MIIELKEQRLIIMPMVVPELLQHFHIKYTFEPGTDHLMPCLIIGTNKYFGQHIYIDVSQIKPFADTPIKVELHDARGIVIKQYTCTTMFNHYGLFGEKPIRPDLEFYVQQLEEHIDDLLVQIQLKESEIKALNEKGDVI